MFDHVHSSFDHVEDVIVVLGLPVFRLFFGPLFFEEGVVADWAAVLVFGLGPADYALSAEDVFAAAGELDWVGTSFLTNGALAVNWKCLSWDDKAFEKDAAGGRHREVRIEFVGSDAGYVLENARCLLNRSLA